MTYRIVDDAKGLSLAEAEQLLTRFLNEGCDCYLQEENYFLRG